MALVRTLPGVLTFTLVDNNAKRSTVGFNVSADVDTIAEVLTAANALRDGIVGVTNARLESARFSFELDEDAPLAVIPPEAEVERKLIISLRGANKRQRADYEIPSPVAAIEQDNTDAVSGANGLVAALITAITTNATTNRGEALTTVAGPLYIDHRNRKRI